MTLPRAHDPRGAPPSTTIGRRSFRWSERTFVMAIINVTPDSFSGDGVLIDRDVAGPEDGDTDPMPRAVAQARQMVADGADLLDVGGESTRPGHDPVAVSEERRRVVPVIAAIRAALPDMPISVDTTKAAVAEAALDAGADMINDVWGVGASDALPRLAAERSVPLVVMHNRAEPRYRQLMPEIVDDLRAALDRARALGVAEDDLIVDPGFGFGKTAEHNLELLRELRQLHALGRPVLIGASRKSTLGRVLEVGPDERLEATLATTAIAIAGGADLVRVHDVRENVRAARMADAIIRGNWRPEPAKGGPS
jgi:dihydropteroate synthase